MWGGQQKILKTTEWPMWYVPLAPRGITNSLTSIPCLGSAREQGRPATRHALIDAAANLRQSA